MAAERRFNVIDGSADDDGYKRSLMARAITHTTLYEASLAAAANLLPRSAAPATTCSMGKAQTNSDREDHAFGGLGNDVIEANVADGGDGNDTMTGQGGFSAILGGNGNDTLASKSLCTEISAMVLPAGRQLT